ncbi:MAG: hypothetical protein A2487_02785 [Candidatus Raymondbacteria bacterium RifOxyC12_full_50_8]|uniref:Flippase-like domain-containing protein n=1 Tax=Candidatus Raymondbacteria bacterium RIFOXYD12_FULL_49_13 TaxID=1817890 RepID=A0A1F7F6L6_UNCRA|nr:MAG: hypothetical protein A2350_06995 [Candidatus Raymondbacteria bacterium RifOxyB12_full_50_8]OGJ93181.1 MAG: hypothetical protein A2248_17570 [Candidatus Raymondbacteria bacterium RIFOXYA2_FULL_49_16]OGJ93369.1 MAG: hypothetical protein A2487_02785 [Candidatus Raymondbacteria bacterium RifOxyC12_full_50_8]OGK02289.1 MAG: hypothetical protein A2519_16590 [Candidatus Raymondbacteria bacterium RIFOXYD12_FULL_49_13]OGP44903.1 MAG: hypothetical protein A2324_19495 [Candidatus Raymondbacteria b
MKKYITITLQAGFSVLLIYFLIRKADFHSVAGYLRACSFKFIALIYASYILLNIGQVLRWYFLVRNFSSDIRVHKILKYHMAAIFFHGFIPSSMSIELIKGYQLSRLIEGKKAYGSVIFGKVMGVGVLFVFFVCIIAFKPSILMQSAFAKQVIWGMAGFLLLGCLVFSKKVSRILFGRFSGFFQTGMLKKVKEFREELYNYRYNVRSLLWAALMSAVIYLGSIAATYFSFRAVSINVPFLACTVYIPVIYTLMMLPVSINGIGLRENLLLVFLSEWQVTPDVMVSSSAIMYAILYTFYLAGGLVILFDRLKGVRSGTEKTDP